MRRQPVWFIIMACAALLLFLALTIREAMLCDGTLVRGLFWWECVR